MDPGPLMLSKAFSIIVALSVTKKLKTMWIWHFHTTNNAWMSRILALAYILLKKTACCRRSCTTALACPRKVAPAGRKLGLVHWILISCIIWTIAQASLPPSCQMLLWHIVIFLVFWSCLLDIKLYVNLWHKLRQLWQIKQISAGGLKLCTSCLQTMCWYDVIPK